VFMGTSGFAVPILHALADRYELVAVVTQPDRPRGRGRGLAMSKVKETALELNLPVLQPERVGDPAFVEWIRAVNPRLIVVAAYGQILPAPLLRAPQMGCVNVHASLLPKYRGAAPVNWALANGESETGVTTILMDEGTDTGPILVSRPVPIGPVDTAPVLEARLAEVGAELIVETIIGLEEGRIEPVAQDSSRASYAPPLKKEDGWIDWNQPAGVLERRIRAFDPWPGTFTRLGDRILKIFRAEVDPGGESQRPGLVLQVGQEGIRVATGSGSLVLKELQLEGRKRLPVQSFVLGHVLEPGTVLGD